MKLHPKARQNDIVIKELEGEILIYDLNSKKVFCLNEASALIWQACDGKRSVSEITNVISKKLKTEVNEDLVWLALDRLKKENLITNSDDIIGNFNGLSRREVIKKIGFSSMVAIPIITSIVAPTAVQAATLTCPPSTPGDCTCSGVPVGSSCSTLQCPSGCSSCRVTQPCFPAPDTNISTCPGICQ